MGGGLLLFLRAVSICSPGAVCRLAHSANPRASGARRTHGSTLEPGCTAIGPITIITALKPQQFVAGERAAATGPGACGATAPVLFSRYLSFSLRRGLSSRSSSASASLQLTRELMAGTVGGDGRPLTSRSDLSLSLSPSQISLKKKPTAEIPAAFCPKLNLLGAPFQCALRPNGGGSYASRPIVNSVFVLVLAALAGPIRPGPFVRWTL